MPGTAATYHFSSMVHRRPPLPNSASPADLYNHETLSHLASPTPVSPDFSYGLPARPELKRAAQFWGGDTAGAHLRARKLLRVVRSRC